jgi:hypothetical protein
MFLRHIVVLVLRDRILGRLLGCSVAAQGYLGYCSSLRIMSRHGHDRRS